MRPLRTIAVVSLLALGLPAVAHASGDDVITDCTKHGTLTRKYSQKDYKNALAHLPADIAEYGNCQSVIRDAQIGGASKGGGGSSGGGSAPSAAFATPNAGAGPAASGTGGAKAGSTSTSSKSDNPTAVDPSNSKASNPSTADENKALLDASQHGGDAVKVGEQAITPGTQNANNVTRGLPAPVIGTLALMGIAAIVGAVLALRRSRRN